VSLIDGRLVDSYGDDAWNGQHNQINFAYYQLKVVPHWDQKKLDRLGQKRSLTCMIEDEVEKKFRHFDGLG
jgi:hypothetical protein